MKPINEIIPEAAQTQHGSLEPSKNGDIESIDLTADELSNAIYEGKKAKFFRLRSEEYWRNVNQQVNYPNFKAEEIYKFLKSKYEIRSPKGDITFCVDDDNAQIVWALCLYFTGDERVKKLNIDPNKGLILHGGVGVGKTELMRFFHTNQKQSFKILSCREVEKNFSTRNPQDETDPLAQYSVIAQTSAVNADPFGHQIQGICFDDLGTESMKSQYYGNVKNVMAEIILNRYDNKLPFNLTHFTTNLPSAEIENTYGTRAADRLYEMCNKITFNVNSKSRRL